MFLVLYYSSTGGSFLILSRLLNLIPATKERHNPVIERIPFQSKVGMCLTYDFVFINHEDNVTLIL